MRSVFKYPKMRVNPTPLAYCARPCRRLAYCARPCRRLAYCARPCLRLAYCARPCLPPAYCVPLTTKRIFTRFHKVDIKYSLWHMGSKMKPLYYYNKSMRMRSKQKDSPEINTGLPGWVFKGDMSDSFTNYNYIGNPKVSVSKLQD